MGGVIRREVKRTKEEKKYQALACYCWDLGINAKKAFLNLQVEKQILSVEGVVKKVVYPYTLKHCKKL